jgi:hypothetical protein
VKAGQINLAFVVERCRYVSTIAPPGHGRKVGERKGLCAVSRVSDSCGLMHRDDLTWISRIHSNPWLASV